MRLVKWINGYNSKIRTFETENLEQIEQKPNYKNNNIRTKIIKTKIWLGQRGAFDRNRLSENIFQTGVTQLRFS